MRHNVSVYNAAYLAVAAMHDAPLVTFDARLAKAAAQAMPNARVTLLRPRPGAASLRFGRGVEDRTPRGRPAAQPNSNAMSPNSCQRYPVSRASACLRRGLLICWSRILSLRVTTTPVIFSSPRCESRKATGLQTPAL
jgi:hypothetical protein